MSGTASPSKQITNDDVVTSNGTRDGSRLQAIDGDEDALRQSDLYEMNGGASQLENRKDDLQENNGMKLAPKPRIRFSNKQ